MGRSEAAQCEAWLACTVSSTTHAMEGLMTLPPLAHSYTLKNKEDFLGQNED
jgi:hypothetical protein